MKKLILILFFTPLISFGQHQTVKQSYKKQLNSGILEKNETEYYDENTGVYSNFKYSVSVKKPKGWEYDFGAGEFTIFRTYEIDSSYTIALTVVESDVYPKKFDAHDILNFSDKNSLIQEYKDKFKKQGKIGISDFNIKKTYLNDQPTLKLSFKEIRRDEDISLQFKNIFYQFVVNGNSIIYGMNIPQFFYSQNPTYFHNLFFINFLSNEYLNFKSETDEEIHPFSHYWESGVAKSESGDYKGAIIEFSKAIELYPDHIATPGTYFARGIVKNTLKLYDEAIDDFSKSIELEYKKEPSIISSIAISYNSRGNSKGLKGDLKGACEDWNRAKELGFKGLDNLIKNYCD